MRRASCKKTIFNFVRLAFALSLISCASGVNAAPDEPASMRLPPIEGLDLFVPVPEDNPLTLSKITLGEELFFDPVLSRGRSLSCSSCHLPDHGFSDTTALSRGAGGRRGTRNAPALLNRGYGRVFF